MCRRKKLVYILPTTYTEREKSAKWHLHKCVTELEKNEEFINPDPSITADIKAYSNYDKLVNGCVPIGTYIEKKDKMQWFH